jgi:hypothetical protein
MPESGKKYHHGHGFDLDAMALTVEVVEVAHDGSEGATFPWLDILVEDP